MTNLRSDMLTTENSKTIKGTPLGYLTGILYLAPHTQSGQGNVCPSASAGCAAACLYSAGRGRFDKVSSARLKKTRMMFDDYNSFEQSLELSIAKVVRSAKRQGLKPAIRINGTSDLPKLARSLASKFPDVQFYDYTKIPKPYSRTLPNYSLTFSRSENNMDKCLDALANGINVAMVFDTKRSGDLPSSYLGYPVIDGDEHDLRFLDNGSGVIIGLRAKGDAKQDDSGFTIRQ